jgi:hypothetical protein
MGLPPFSTQSVPAFTPSSLPLFLDPTVRHSALFPPLLEIVSFKCLLRRVSTYVVGTIFSRCYGFEYLQKYPLLYHNLSCQLLYHRRKSHQGVHVPPLLLLLPVECNRTSIPELSITVDSVVPIKFEMHTPLVQSCTKVYLELRSKFFSDTTYPVDI